MRVKLMMVSQGCNNAEKGKGKKKGLGNILLIDVSASLVLLF